MHYQNEGEKKNLDKVSKVKVAGVVVQNENKCIDTFQKIAARLQ